MRSPGSRHVVVILTALLLALVVAPSASAFTPRGGNTVVVAEQIRDDLYVGGGTVDVTGDIDGDVVAAGGTVSISGPVTGGILAAGGNLTIRGSAGRSIRAAAGSLVIAGEVGTDAVLAGGNVTIERAAQVARDLVVAGGSVQVSGSVRRDAYLTGGSIVIGGTIQGDVDAQADRVVLLPSARIGGALRYAAREPVEIQQGAQVSGQVIRVERPSRSRTVLNPAARFGFRFAGRVLEALWLLAIGFVLLAITPRGVRHVQGQVGSHFGLSVLIGFILIVVVPVAAVLLLITIVGIPLALVVTLLYVATAYPSLVFVSTWLGEAILRRLGGRQTSGAPYLSVAVGVAVLVVLVALPFVGWVVRLLALCAGFGALWTAIWSVRTRPREPA